VASDVITIKNAFNLLSEGLKKQEKYKVGSFKNFLQNIWCYSFDNPEYFQAWHVEVLADDIEECVETGMNYVAVLPRFHFKSTILGHAFSVWRLLTAPRDCSVLYLSYSDGMAKYHISEINKAISRNPVLKELLVNRNPKADFSARYYLNNKPMDIMHGGLFSFKRGLHVNGALIADDVLRDPENPLNTGQITKVEDHFMTESLFIPLKGVPVIVLGTPMMPGDLLSKLQEDSRFKSRVLPALDPVPKRRVLMPELYSEEWLLQQQKARPKSFASEFMLIPHFSTESYFNEDDITKCEDSKLRSAPATQVFQDLEPGDQVFGGFDVGKKRHPSHLVLFRKRGERIEQIHQSFLDGWSYSDQIEYLNEVAENFNLTSGYIDNTRGELEDRGLDTRWLAKMFSRKSKNTMAHIFEKFIHSGNLRLIKDERQKQQILSVSNELKAPQTPMGHGDAFFSIAMALEAVHETAYKFVDLGSATEWFNAVSPYETPEGRLEQLDNKGLGNVNKNSPAQALKLEPVNAEQLMTSAPNPQCKELVCSPSFWVAERGLCLYCGIRK
tara:strand:+ start:1558 stop:3225 length:1668 start_codon:yes stop_codon:yes gene_type:complete